MTNVSTTVEYREVVRAARDTAERLLNRGNPATGYTVRVNTEAGETASVSWSDFDVLLKLPSLKPETRMLRHEADRITGFVAHECCHVLYTNWAAWEKAVQAGSDIARLTNGIEDVRIEAREIGTGYLPNLRNVLSATLQWKHWEASQHRAANKLPPCGAIAGDMSYVLCVLGRLANGYDVPAATNLRRDLPARFQPIVTYALGKLPALQSTEDSLKLAREIARRMKALAKPTDPAPNKQAPGNDEQAPGEPGEPGEGEQAPGEPGEPGEGEQAPGGEPGEPGEGEQAPGEPGEPGEGEQAPGEPGEGEQAPGEPGDPGEGQGGAATVPPIEPGADLGDMVRASAERTGDKARSGNLSGLNTFDRATRAVARCPLGVSAGTDIIAKLRGLTEKPARLRGQVARLVRSQETNGRDRYRSVGRLDQRALTRCATGAANVYTRRVAAPGVDTAVLVLLDGSGSMTNRMPLAWLTALHLTEAVEAARGKVAVAGFHGQNAKVRLTMVKGWSERFDPTRLLGVDASTATPLACAILAGADYLREVHVDRRIMLVLTDGACDLGPDCVQSAVALATRRGVECAGVGIETDVSYAFPVHARVDNPRQLATMGLATLARALEGGGPK